MKAPVIEEIPAGAVSDLSKSMSAGCGSVKTFIQGRWFQSAAKVAEATSYAQGFATFPFTPSLGK